MVALEKPVPFDGRRSSKKQNWRTPPELFRWVESLLGAPFTLDVAADTQNHLCDRYFTEQTNSLVHSWSLFRLRDGSLCGCFCHPCNRVASSILPAQECSVCRSCEPTPSRVWLNPPYGLDAHKKSLQDPFFVKAYAELRAGHAEAVVMLVPPRTETPRWHTYVSRAEEVWLLKGRVSFIGDSGKPVSGNGAGSTVIIFEPARREAYQANPRLHFLTPPTYRGKQ